MSYQDVDIIVSTTLPTIDRLSTYKNGWDALFLYFRYVKQARLQKTNTTYSNNKFMCKAMWRSSNKLVKVKKILRDEWLIETVTRQWEDGKIEGKYVKVNFIISETTTPKNHAVEKPSDGKMITNAWSNKINAWSNKIKCFVFENKNYEQKEAIEYIYKTYRDSIPVKNKKWTKSQDSLLQIEAQLKEYSMEELMKAQKNYIKATDRDYIMACQYFYSNKKTGKTYKPFVDYIEMKTEETKKVNINFNDIF